jgi:subtilisin family serine protease
MEDLTLDRPLVKSKRVLAQLQSGIMAPGVASRHGITVVRTLKSSPDWVVFEAPSVAAAERAEASLKKDSAVLNSWNDSFVLIKPTSFVPNDPFYPRNMVLMLDGQWHLGPDRPGFVSANVDAAWALGATGDRVTIGIVDDSYETRHPDLSQNFNADLSFSFAFNVASPDPDPFDPFMGHGISVAGVAGARGGNREGVTGAAPFAPMAGLQIAFSGDFISTVADAMMFFSSGPLLNRKIQIKNHSYGFNIAYVPILQWKEALEAGSRVGTIHVMAAGNARGTRSQDTNGLYMTSSPLTIPVAATGRNGRFSFYSSFGAGVAVAAPSDDGTTGITTTDRMGLDGFNGIITNSNYTNQFGGTSSAAPLVSGILALVKQGTPALDGRSSKHLLARNSDRVDPLDSTPSSDGGWLVNAAGIAHNQNYGWGKVNAGRLVLAGRRITGASPLLQRTLPRATVAAVIPDNDPAGLVRTFTVTDTAPLEDVSVYIRAVHPRPQDLEVFLTSPSGRRVRMMSLISGSVFTSNLAWSYNALGFWGENPQGTWRLQVRDRVRDAEGSWDFAELTLRMGHTTSRLGSTIASNNANGTSFYTALLEGRPTTSQNLPNAPTSTSMPAFYGDVNRDGITDAVYNDPSGQVRALTLNRGERTGVINVGNIGSQRLIGATDTDGDGDVEYITFDPATRNVIIRTTANALINGTRTIGALDAGFEATAIGDFDADGNFDILTENRTTNRLVAWRLNASRAPVGTTALGALLPNTTSTSVGDINFDGQLDILLYNTTLRSVAVAVVEAGRITRYQGVLGAQPVGRTVKLAAL